MHKSSSHVVDIKKLKGLSSSIRKSALVMTSIGGSSHIGSILSIADILSALYGGILKFKVNQPKWPGRDRFILSKGHAGAGVYAVLAEKGFISKDMLRTHYQNGSVLSGHVSHKGIPGVEFSTGSLGHGLPVAAGMALSAKINNEQHRVFVLMSDGECDEGSNWEAILFASHNKLDNLVAIIDRNMLQSIKSTENTLSLEPFSSKWKSFGWEVLEIDGHNHKEILDACSDRHAFLGRPLCVIAKTTKGKGVSFMEDNVLWHYRSPQGEEYEMALSELENG